MHLAGSCHCGAVRFSLKSRNAVPYQRCYCSICRKTQGGGGYAINLSGDSASLQVTGRDNISTFHAHIHTPGEPTRVSEAERTFCKLCGTALWLFSANWPELIHPFASAIDTDLPTPPVHTHLIVAFKPGWVEPEQHPGDLVFDNYPDESIADWHARHRLET